ncbi:MAG TPA: hypothetical protein VNW51_04270 [Mucilaginibacter sp.]|nr:hypothetical protein [Mucilaginibacter sp.]
MGSPLLAQKPHHNFKPGSSKSTSSDKVSLRATKLGIPTLDELAGDWLSMPDIANPPAVHNFNQMLVVNRDLTSYFCNPGALYGGYYGKGDWSKGYPMVTLTIDGQEYPAQQARCYAYRALRRNLFCNGMAVETDTRMVNEERTVLCQISARNSTPISRQFHLSLHVPGVLQADGTGVVNTTQRKDVTSVIRPSLKPDTIIIDGDDVIWQWNLKLTPGRSVNIGFAAGDGANADKTATEQRIADRATHFAATFAGCKQVWEDRWADVFTPENKHFSGHLPILKTSDRALARNYYVGAWTMLALERTQFPVHPRSFITSGERFDGEQFYWDASMQATAWAMLEPEGMKATLRRWLVQNPRSGSTINIKQTKGFDAKYHDHMTGYAFNAATIFKTAYDYLRLTGDRAFLNEKLENGKTVLEQMLMYATDWQTLPAGPAGSGLVNYGENRNLLECAPAYINCIPSLHAQDVWMMRCAADLYDLHGAVGDHEQAKVLRAGADKLLPAVLALYKPGEGVWNAYHEDGKKVELRHCVDYIYVGNALKDDLTKKQKNEMNDFVKKELFMRDWMRAMSLKDEAAKKSDRPDHGPMGAYDGWIPLTVGTMWRLGSPADAFAFYDRTSVVTQEGPFAQAREFYGPNRIDYNAPVRVALRQGCMKECISGAAFSDVVINTFFGFSPGFDGKGLIVDPSTSRPFKGRLLNVPFNGRSYNLTADIKGVKIEKERH